MIKFFFGFILGAILATAISHLHQSGSQPVNRPLTETHGDANARAKVEEYQSSSAAEAPLVNKPSSPDYEKERQTTQTNESVRQQAQDSLVPEVAGSTPADESKSHYSPEIASVLEGSVPRKLQERYESEQREESWATYMEGQLTAYFAGKPGLVQFTIPLIDCRTSICEIHAIGYGPDAYTVWSTSISDITHQPWHDFNRLSGSVKDVQPDVVGIVLILAKNVE